MARRKSLENMAKKGEWQQLSAGVAAEIAKRIETTEDIDALTGLVHELTGLMKVAKTFGKTDTPDEAKKTTVLELVRSKKGKSA